MACLSIKQKPSGKDNIFLCIYDLPIGPGAMLNSRGKKKIRFPSILLTNHTHAFTLMPRGMYSFAAAFVNHSTGALEPWYVE